MHVKYIDWNDKLKKEVLTKRNIAEGDFNSKDYVNLTLLVDCISYCMTKVGAGNCGG